MQTITRNTNGHTYDLTLQENGNVNIVVDKQYERTDCPFGEICSAKRTIGLGVKKNDRLDFMDFTPQQWYNTLCAADLHFAHQLLVQFTHFGERIIVELPSFMPVTKANKEEQLKSQTEEYDVLQKKYDALLLKHNQHVTTYDVLQSKYYEMACQFDKLKNNVKNIKIILED